MKFALISALLFIGHPISFAAPTYTVPSTEVRKETIQKPPKKEEPSAIPCPPQKTRKEKLDDLAKVEGEGETHSTNCPAQGAIIEEPQKR